MPRTTSPRGGAGGETGSAAPFIPKVVPLTLTVLREAVQGCRGCDLYKRATQAVFGRGPRAATIMFVGEQPGDQEDLQGQPFVGPAGKMLNEGLEQAGIDRAEVYVTNAVKHFKWEPGGDRGKRRIHSRPSARQIKACRPWLEAELEVIEPRIVVAMGATAAQALLGGSFRLTQHRGEFLEGTPWAPLVTATVHPSAVLRAPDAEARERMRREFFEDLRGIAARVRRPITSERAGKAGRDAQGPRRGRRGPGLFDGDQAAPGVGPRRPKAAAKRRGRSS